MTYGGRTIPGTDFTGAFRLRGEPGYEQSRVGRIFNARRPDRYPAAILEAESEDDCVRGVRLAARRGWQVAVRSGGHSYPAWSLRDSSLLIDVSGLTGISYDEATGVVSLPPASVAGEFEPYLAERGRFFNGPRVPTVGLGGFLLQGGMGWNARGWGWACENLVAVEVVTADGELVRADEAENADLLWAARGAGPGFPGVVTRFHLRTRPLHRTVARSVYIYRADAVAEVVTWLHEVSRSVSPDVEIAALCMTMPLPPEVQDPGGPVLLVSAVALVDSMEDAVDALAPLDACPVVQHALLRDFARSTSMEEMRDEQQRGAVQGLRWAADDAWLNAGPEQYAGTFQQACATLPAGKSFALWYSMAPVRELPDMALSLQAEAFIGLYAVWTDEGDDERHRAWLARQMHRIEPFSPGCYLGDADLEARQARFMADPQFGRLQRIQAARDPDGVFAGYLASDRFPVNSNPRPPG